MTKEQVSYVQFNCKTDFVRACCKLVGIDVTHAYEAKEVVYADLGGDVSYDELAKLAEFIGTTNINLMSETGIGGDLTPPDHYLAIEIRWPDPGRLDNT